MKRIISIALCVIMVFSIAGCSNQEAKKSAKVVTTIFPIYDFVRQIMGSGDDVEMLITPGVEVHGFEPTPQQIIAIGECELFIYIGGESDEWVNDVLESVKNKPKTLALIDCIEPIEEDEGNHLDHKETEVEYDEHIWTSPKNAIKMVDAISGALNEAGLMEKAQKDNMIAYIEKLYALDKRIEDVVSNGKHRKIICADRFPFAYLMKDYGLEYDAAFPGCSEQTEPSAATVARLISEVINERIGVVVYTEQSNQKLADTIVTETGAKKMLLHSCHNVSSDDFESGIDYITLMEKNIDTLKEALG